MLSVPSLSVLMLSVIMLSVLMLSVITLSLVILSVTLYVKAPGNISILDWSIMQNYHFWCHVAE